MNNKIHHHSCKDHIKNSKSAKFGREMLKNAENIALQNLPILYTFVLRAEICTTFTRTWKKFTINLQVDYSVVVI